jgi:hypothetical protein
MSDQLLSLELRFLILRYSRRRLIEALAKLGDQTFEDVERELSLALEHKARRSKPKDRPTSELIAEACRDRPDTRELVTTIVNRFENHSFLPQLRDVTRFLDRAGTSHGKLKSRRASTPKVVEALAARTVDELRQLAAAPSAESESDFAILAREIMAGGRPRRPPKDGDRESKESIKQR